MSQSQRVSFQECFSTLTDPRRRKVVYPLVNVVTIAICAVLCGADDFVSIAEFGRAKRKWLAKFLDLSAGIPSHDRFNAILGALKIEEFQQCLLDFSSTVGLRFFRLRCCKLRTYVEFRQAGVKL